MLEKEKKALKYFYNLKTTIDESNMLFGEDINVRCGKEMMKQITLILNLIQNQQAELEKKDKMIDYMANFINDNIPYTKYLRVLENERGVRNTEYTKQYFERKAK